MNFPDTLIYDADELLFTVCKACEQEVEFDDEITMHSDKGDVHRMLLQRIEDAEQYTGCSSTHLAFSDPESNYRNQVLPSYKQHRKSTGKPVGYWQAKDWLTAQLVSLEYPTLEADDVMGILADEYEVIVSSDKDLLTVPGRHWSPYKHRRNGSAPIVTMSEEQADWMFLWQTLTGDPVDGFKGCPGVGKVKATRLLSDVSGREGIIPANRLMAAWSAVVSAYVSAGKRKADALQQARCARILRPGEWDARTGVILWTVTYGA
jgi:DNA polymerase-1